MTLIDFIFLFYMFLGLYMLSLFIFLYFPNKNKLFSYPKGKDVPVSIVIPCYNEGALIGETIESLLGLEYPKEMIEIIVVDDKSSDNSVEVIKRYTKKYKNVKLIVNKRNSGGAAEPTNIGIKAAKYDFIAVTDADSTPQKDALKKMIGFLQQDERVAAVTCSVLAKEPKNFIQRLQAVEYAVIAINRKLLDLVDAVYVTPGPFALYRKSALIEVGLFDTRNMTQDIEIVWRLQSYGYIPRMSLDTAVYSSTPNKLRQWFKQRIRWTIGGTQTLYKYRKDLIGTGMLGYFIIPFFTVSLFLGLLGLGLFLYLWIRGLVISYISTRYSIYASTAVFRFGEFSFMPSVLNFFGFVLFILGTWLTFFSLRIMQQRKLPHGKFYNIMFYLLVYLTLQPIVLVVALYKMIRRTYSW